jgi:hypothetical protein
MPAGHGHGLGLVEFCLVGVVAVPVEPAMGRAVRDEAARVDHMAGGGHIGPDEVSGLATWPDGTVGGRYGFRHALYRDVLYGRLGAGQQARLHLALGGRKAAGFAERAVEIAVELAMHFEHGGAMLQAAHYYRQAGEKALRQHAYQETLAHAEKGLALLQREPARADATRQELELHITRGAALLATSGFSSREVESTYARARSLSQRLDDASVLAPALYGLWNFSLTRSDLPEARALADELFALAERALCERWRLLSSKRPSRWSCARP